MLSDEETVTAFDQFREAFVPGHMHKQFLKFFGMPKAAFTNRFFTDDATFVDLDTRFSRYGIPEDAVIEATVIYGNEDELEAYALKGQGRRSARDLFIDDWHAACAIVTHGDLTLYIFIGLRMKGCLVYPTSA